MLPRERISRAIGRVAEMRPPRGLLARAIDLYVRAYDVDLSECDVPEGGYRSFNEFFTRPLKDGARPVDPDPAALVSPADGRVEDAGPIEEGACFRVKGRGYDVGELLGDARDAARFVGGRFVVVYLSPRDYHRVHAPIEGAVRCVRHLGGTLFPVNRIGVEHVPRLFAKNERVAIHQHGAVHGEVATVMVGAMVVGGIRLAFDPGVRTNASGTRLRSEVREYGAADHVIGKGEELGHFQLGSTAIVLTPRGRPVHLEVRAGDVVRVGQPIGRIDAHARAAVGSA